MLDKVYRPSDDVVMRRLEGEVIIIPLVAGIGDLEDELYSLNETGQAIWERLDGEKSVQIIADELASQYRTSSAEIQEDVVGLVHELVRRKIIVTVLE